MMDPVSSTTPVFSLTRNSLITCEDVLQLCSQRLFTVNSVAAAPNLLIQSIFGNTPKAEVIRNEAISLLLQSQVGAGFITTGVRKIDQLFGGGIPANSIVQLTGDKGLGKSLFCMQICVTMQMQFNPTPDKALYLSNDCNFRSDRISRLSERFDLKPNVVGENIRARHIFSTDFLLQTLQSAAKDNVAQRYKLIVIDSITGLFKNRISRRVEQVTRNKFFVEITAAIYSISKLHNATVILVQETDGYAEMDEILGINLYHKSTPAVTQVYTCTK